MNTIQVGVLTWLAMFMGTFSASAIAQTEAKPAPAAASSETPPPLATEQKQVAERFSRLEALLLRSADLEAGENPARAALLQQAVQLSKQAALTEQLADAASRLEQGQFSEAIEKQKTSRENLKRLLELLQSENREKRIREERDEVRRWIEETDRLLRLQSSLRGRTEGGQETEQAAKDQEKLADKASDISQELNGEESTQKNQDDSADSNSPESNSADPEEKSDSSDPSSKPTNESSEKQTPGSEENNDSKSGDKGNEQKDSKQDANKDSEPSGDQTKNETPADKKSPERTGDKDSSKGDSAKQDANSDTQKGKEPGQPSDATESPKNPADASGDPDSKQPAGQPPQPGQQQPSQQKSNQGSPGQSGKPSDEVQPAPPQSPTQRAKQKIEQAQKNMKEPQQELESAKREGAVEKQREAEERLREAIEELEEILRQLREEEVERSLASLETRLRRMLAMQTKVLEETNRLQEITGDAAIRQVQIAASKLALDERKVLAEGERAFLLLREEGSSAAFPEALEQLNADISSVVDRLNKGDVGALTVNIEQEIVSSIEEMVEALVQVQKDKRDKKQQDQPAPGQGPAGGEPGDQPLVDKLAELRLIRTLQLRINNRTSTLSKLLADPNDPIGQAAESDVQQQLKGLAERQSSIQGVTRDIVVGKGE